MQSKRLSVYCSKKHVSIKQGGRVSDTCSFLFKFSRISSSVWTNNLTFNLQSLDHYTYWYLNTENIKTAKSNFKSKLTSATQRR